MPGVLISWEPACCDVLCSVVFTGGDRLTNPAKVSKHNKTTTPNPNRCCAG
jgi:hypothetical protein